MSLEKTIEMIKQRPGAFFGTIDKTTVEAIGIFLRGYLYAKETTSELDSFERGFRTKFTKYIYEKYSVIPTHYIPWYTVIREHTEDEKAARDKFFELYDEFREKFYSNTLVFED